MNMNTDNRVMTLDEACDLHRMATDASEAFRQKGVGDGGRAVWNAIVGISEEAGDTPMADAVRITMPTDYIPLLRGRAGLAAAFAFEALAAFMPALGCADHEYRKACEKAWVAFEERRQLANNVEEGFGWDHSASWETVREATAFGDVKHVEEIAKLAGRMFKAMSVDGAKVVTDDPEEVRDVNLGGDPERLLAGELAQLFTPGLDDMAAVRILEKQAQQYRMKGHSPATRGPLVICVDESGSMHDEVAYGNTGRNTWAKAAAVALTRVAHEGNRMVRVVHFAAGVKLTECAPGDHQAVLDMSRSFLSGGTDIAKALAAAHTQVGDLAANGHIGADVVLITDGEDGDSAKQDSVLNLLQAQGVRLWTVAIEMQLEQTAPIAWRAQQVIRVGATLEADAIAALRAAASNVVSKADLDAAAKAMN
jgi:hypothetical protein